MACACRAGTARCRANRSGLALLLHGWEGSAESSYMRMTAARLLEAGFEVVRLNFRDHGDTHHLNQEIFHSNRLDEVVNAAVEVARRFPPAVRGGRLFAGRQFRPAPGPARAAGGLGAGAGGAVCPVLDPRPR